MNSFQKAVRKDLSPPLGRLGFKQVMVEPAFASFAIQVSAEVGLYLIVHDWRASGRNLEVALWAAPISKADDSIERLGVGLKIVVASDYDVPQDYFKQCALKVKRYLPACRNFESFVSSELASPFLNTKRLQVYACERAWWNASHRFFHPEAKRAVELIESCFRAKRQTPATYEQAEAAASVLIQHARKGNELEITAEIPPLFWTFDSKMQIYVVLNHFLARSDLP